MINRAVFNEIKLELVRQWYENNLNDEDKELVLYHVKILINQMEYHYYEDNHPTPDWLMLSRLMYSFHYITKQFEDYPFYTGWAFDYRRSIA